MSGGNTKMSFALRYIRNHFEPSIGMKIRSTSPNAINKKNYDTVLLKYLNPIAG